MNILIKQAQIITSDNSYVSDLLICDGKINKISQNIAVDPANTLIINAKNQYLFPGGIDPHVHFNLPTPAGYSSDDFATGSKAALYGGTTSIIDFVTPQKGQSLVEAFENRNYEAQNCLVDYKFHVSPIEWTVNTKADIHGCVKLGVNSFKVYMAYKESIGLNDEDLEKVIEVVAKEGGILTVHAETGDEISRLRESYGKNKDLAPIFHAKSRPSHTESEAVNKVITLAKKHSCALYIVHVSAKESLAYIKKAQEDGQKVYAEVCPHHLLLDKSKYLGEFHETSPYVLSPPLRSKEDNKALWEALSSGVIQTTGTDHCSFTKAQKSFGATDFRKIPNGAGGVEHRLALLFTYGVLMNKISLNKFVEVTSTNAAKIFGLYPQKGEIAEGSDADLVVWNPIKESIISPKTHHQNCDINIYENMITIGAPEYVIKSGQVVIDKGNFIYPSKP